jgi:hypothetical protein
VVRVIRVARVIRVGRIEPLRLSGLLGLLLFRVSMVFRIISECYCCCSKLLGLYLCFPSSLTLSSSLILFLLPFSLTFTVQSGSLASSLTFPSQSYVSCPV